MLAPMLHELGLRDQDIDLYTYALAFGPMPITKLADHLGMSAPNVYKLIARLAAVGLSSFSAKSGYGRSFTVVAPSVLSELIQKKREEVERMSNQLQAFMPDLLANYHQGDTPTKVRILQGKDQFHTAITRMFDEAKDEVLVFGSIHDFIGCIAPTAFEALTKRRLQRGIGVRLLVLPCKEVEHLERNAQKEARQIRTISDAPTFSASFQLSQHQVIIWQPQAPLALIIEDEVIVAMLRVMFEMLWEKNESTPKENMSFSKK